MTEEEIKEEPQIDLPQEENKQEEKPEDFQDKYFRLLAEMENSRKRMQKEKHEMNRFAIENVIAEIIHPIDTFENALSFTDQMNEETRNWAKGFEMILTQFREILSNHNVEPFRSKGEAFDPYKHEAVEMEETTDHADGTIITEFLKGYKSGNRVLRAARVKVAKAPVVEESIKEENKESTHDREEEAK